MPKLSSAFTVFISALRLGAPLRAAEAAPGMVSHLKVISDRIEDVSSLAAWNATFIRDAMSEQEKAVAIWTSVCKFRHQALPPSEGLIVGPARESHVHDPITDFNVYCNGQCCCASFRACRNARALRRTGDARLGHQQPQRARNQSRRPLVHVRRLAHEHIPAAHKKTIAGVSEIHTSIVDWLEEHPENKDKRGKELEAQMGRGGRR